MGVELGGIGTHPPQEKSVQCAGGLVTRGEGYARIASGSPGTTGMLGGRREGVALRSRCRMP